LSPPIDALSVPPGGKRQTDRYAVDVRDHVTRLVGYSHREKASLVKVVVSHLDSPFLHVSSLAMNMPKRQRAKSQRKKTERHRDGQRAPPSFSSLPVSFLQRGGRKRKRPHTPPALGHPPSPRLHAPLSSILSKRLDRERERESKREGLAYTQSRSRKGSNDTGAGSTRSLNPAHQRGPSVLAWSFVGREFPFRGATCVCTR